jgi:hypothetical protein
MLQEECLDLQLLVNAGRAGRIELSDEPVQGDGESLVRVGAVGICDSDLRWFPRAAMGDAVLTRPVCSLEKCAAAVISRSDVTVSDARTGPRVVGLSVGLAVLRCAQVGQGVGAFVAWSAVVSSDPVPLDSVSAGRVVERTPQVAVLDGLLVSGLPAARLPVVDPLGDALANVLAIAEQDDLAGSPQRGERLDG